MGRPKGHPKTGGRQKGTPNKLTRSAKEAYAFAFDALGGAEGLRDWALRDPDNMKVFYQLHARLIPTEKDVRLEIGDAERLKAMSLDELEAMAKAAGLDL